MGQRSYLMATAPEGAVALLEAEDSVPLLWVGLLDDALLSQSFSQGATLRLADGEARGLDLDRAASLRRLGELRTHVAHWVGDAAAVVLDQFGAFLEAAPGAQLRLDIAEWLDSFATPAEGQEELRTMLRMLATRPAARRPRHVKQVLDRAGLTKRAPEEPAYGVLLAGTACNGREPWRRDPPREYRRADDTLRWATGDVAVSADGRVAWANLTNAAHLKTPVRWSADGTGEPTPLALDDALGWLHLHGDAISADGAAVFGTCQWHPGPLELACRLDAEGRLVTIAAPDAATFVPVCTDAAGIRAGGWVAATREPKAPDRAAVWSAATGVQLLPSPEGDTSVRALSADGRIAVGICRQAANNICLALVWSDDAAPQTVAEFFSVGWRALASTGDRGLLDVMTGYGVHGAPRYWHAGRALLPVEDAVGEALRDPVMSTDGTAVVGHTQEGLCLWIPDAPPRLLLDARRARHLQARAVGSGGAWFAATEEDPDTRGTAAVIIGDAAGRTVRHPVFLPDTVVTLARCNRAAAPEDIALTGFVRYTYEPLTWTIRRGLLRWGATSDC